MLLSAHAPRIPGRIFRSLSDEIRTAATNRRASRDPASKQPQDSLKTALLVPHSVDTPEPTR